MDKKFLVFEEKQEDCRLDKYIASEIEEMSRNSAQILIKEGNVLVNGEVVKSSYILKYGDKIEVLIPDPVMDEITPENIPLDIYYEDSDVIVVNKESGMVVHPGAGVKDGTAMNAMLYHFPQTAQLASRYGIRLPRPVLLLQGMSGRGQKIQDQRRAGVPVREGTGRRRRQRFPECHDLDLCLPEGTDRIPADGADSSRQRDPEFLPDRRRYEQGLDCRDQCGDLPEPERVEKSLQNHLDRILCEYVDFRHAADSGGGQCPQFGE